MSTEYNRADIIDLRERINKLEDEVAKTVVKLSVITTLIALVLPAVITIAPGLFLGR